MEDFKAWGGCVGHVDEQSRARGHHRAHSAQRKRRPHSSSQPLPCAKLACAASSSEVLIQRRHPGLCVNFFFFSVLSGTGYFVWIFYTLRVEHKLAVGSTWQRVGHDGFGTAPYLERKHAFKCWQWSAGWHDRPGRLSPLLPSTSTTWLFQTLILSC